jgi:C4-type Zn-finger protein
MGETPLHNCWHCGKSLLHIDVAKGLADVPFFHCDKICQSKCKRWNYKPKEITDEEWNQKVEIEVVEVEDEPTRDDYECKHKYNCAKHRDVCVAKHGYSNF